MAQFNKFKNIIMGFNAKTKNNALITKTDRAKNTLTFDEVLVAWDRVKNKEISNAWELAKELGYAKDNVAITPTKIWLMQWVLPIIEETRKEIHEKERSQKFNITLQVEKSILRRHHELIIKQMIERQIA